MSELIIIVPSESAVTGKYSRKWMNIPHELMSAFLMQVNTGLLLHLEETPCC